MKVDDIGNNKIVRENKESEEKNMSYTKEQSNNIHEARNDVELSEIYMLQRKRDTKGMKKNSEGERQNNVIDKVVTRKEYREWIEDLHARFMQVVHQLGFPKEIVEVMNLPGLTRMQVASHLQVQPHYLNINDNSFNNPFLSPQTNVTGELQQHGPLFGMLGSQGLQDSIIGNTNFGPAMTLNNEDNLTEKNYNFDLNVAEGATYSGSRIVAMMSDTYVENVTINGLGETNTNANSQQYVSEPIMSGPRNIVVASYENNVVGSNSNEKENSDAYLNFNNMDYLFQNIRPSGANLPNEQGNEFDQVYSDNQNLGPPSANLPNQQDSEFDQVYFDDQNLGPPSANLPNEHDSEFDQVYSDDQVTGASAPDSQE
ncbi:hypothetical protein H5410_064697 [Solanum commersonii]|uniref:Uncharacterized protein n=1 Tax=Solanum commersonii TaxID=4109 RepID=A0A9J5VYN3_SOLCO|nr:hypothetical protein H5410_064697 [Solanum commersonii]